MWLRQFSHLLAQCMTGRQAVAEPVCLRSAESHPGKTSGALPIESSAKISTRCKSRLLICTQSNPALCLAAKVESGDSFALQACDILGFALTIFIRAPIEISGFSGSLGNAIWRLCIEASPQKSALFSRSTDFQLAITGKPRNIKGAHFAVGCGYSHHHLPKGAPL